MTARWSPNWLTGRLDQTSNKPVKAARRWWLAGISETVSVERGRKGPDTLQMRFGNEIMGTVEPKELCNPCLYLLMGVEFLRGFGRVQRDTQRNRS